MTAKEEAGRATSTTGTLSSSSQLDCTEPVVTLKTWLVCGVEPPSPFESSKYCDNDNHRFFPWVMASLSGLSLRCRLLGLSFLLHLMSPVLLFGLFL